MKEQFGAFTVDIGDYVDCGEYGQAYIVDFVDDRFMVNDAKFADSNSSSNRTISKRFVSHIVRLCCDTALEDNDWDK